MSNNELEKILSNKWFDSESDLLNISLFSQSSNLGVNVNQSFLNPQNNLALEVDYENIAGSAMNKGNHIGNACLKRKDS